MPENRNQWLIEISRPVTMKDYEDGICGANIVKKIIVLGETSKEARKTAIIEEGFEIKSCKNWGKLREKIHLENLKWIMNN